MRLTRLVAAATLACGCAATSRSAPVASHATTQRFDERPAPVPSFTDPARRAKLATAYSKLGAHFAQYRASQKLPGLAVGLVVDGELAWSRAYGVADLASNAPVDVDTRFEIGSITKPFTALAVLRLRDEGKLSLDAPAATYLPELRSLGHRVARIGDAVPRLSARQRLAADRDGHDGLVGARRREERATRERIRPGERWRARCERAVGHRRSRGGRRALLERSRDGEVPRLSTRCMARTQRDFERPRASQLEARDAADSMGRRRRAGSSGRQRARLGESVPGGLANVRRNFGACHFDRDLPPKDANEAHWQMTCEHGVAEIWASIAQVEPLVLDGLSWGIRLDDRYETDVAPGPPNDPRCAD